MNPNFSLNCSLNFKLPSKTFLLGEYGVLKDSPSLVLCTPPFFEFKESQKESKSNNLSGPILNFLNEFPGKSFETVDPWEGSGGFGASSAQFAAVYKLQNPFDHLDEAYVNKMLSTYRNFYWNGQGLPPSGHDVIAQMMGVGICLIDTVTHTYKKIESQLLEYDFLILKTNLKIATHEHLNSLKNIHFDLRGIVEQACEGLQNGNLLQFISAIEEQNRILHEHDFICEETLALRRKLEDQAGVIITKGCGALGADTILIVCENDKTAPILELYPTAFKA